MARPSEGRRFDGHRRRVGGGRQHLLHRRDERRQLTGRGIGRDERRQGRGRGAARRRGRGRAADRRAGCNRRRGECGDAAISWGVAASAPPSSAGIDRESAHPAVSITSTIAAPKARLRAGTAASQRAWRTGSSTNRYDSAESPTAITTAAKRWVQFERSPTGVGEHEHRPVPEVQRVGVTADPLQHRRPCSDRARRVRRRSPPSSPAPGPARPCPATASPRRSGRRRRR